MATSLDSASSHSETAAPVRGTVSEISKLMTTAIGTLEYLAPELCQTNSRFTEYGFMVDQYSFGCELSVL